MAGLTANTTELPRWLYLWLPLVVVLLLVGINQVSPEFYLLWLEGELGFVELCTPLVLLPGIYFGFRVFLVSQQQVKTWLRIWFMLVTLACVYMAGEEISWGQHLLGWETPASLQGVNDQNETNLHNISSWFDQKPRILLEIWVLIGGIILPISRSLNKYSYSPNDDRYWFWPTHVCLPAACIAILIKFPERIKDVFQLDPYQFEIRWSEAQELYFAVFLALYLVSLYRRMQARSITA